MDRSIDKLEKLTPEEIKAISPEGRVEILTSYMREVSELLFDDEVSSVMTIVDSKHGLLATCDTNLEPPEGESLDEHVKLTGLRLLALAPVLAIMGEGDEMTIRCVVNEAEVGWTTWHRHGPACMPKDKNGGTVH
jgi:hypothetical protein